MKEKSNRFKSILNAVASVLVVPIFVLASQTSSLAVQPQVAAGGYHTVGLKSDGTVVAVGDNRIGQLNVVSWTGIVQVAAAGGLEEIQYGYISCAHTVGVKSDGTVVAVGDNSRGQLNVVGWTDIVQVAAGAYCENEFDPPFAHTVGVKFDGKVVAVGDNRNGQLNVFNWTDIVKIAASGKHTVGVKSDGTVVAAGSNESGQLNVDSWSEIVQVAAGLRHTVGVKSDGTAVAVGNNVAGQLNVGSWTDIVQVAAGQYHTVGVKSDGTVVAVGDNSRGQLEVGSWTDVVKVAAGGEHTVSVTSDGTVVTVGDNFFGQCNVGSWTDIVQVAAGSLHNVGLKFSSTVVAVGNDYYGWCDVGSWTDIEQVAAGGGKTVGVKSDGTVVAVGLNIDGQLNVVSWSEIVQVAAGQYHTVGVKSDGTVVAVGDNSRGQLDVGSWTDIVQVAAGGDHTVGLKSNGTVVAVGSNYQGQLNVGSWTDIVQVTTAGLRFSDYAYTVGVKSDGTVVAVGNNWEGQINVGSWTGIVQVAAGIKHTVGVKSDGTVVAVGDNFKGQLNVGSWTDIVQVAAGGNHTVGVKSDGTAVAVGDNYYGQCNLFDWDLIVDKNLLYTPVTPCKIVDTRNPSAGMIDAGTQRNFYVHGSAATISAQGGNPAGCLAPLGEPSAAHINLVAVDPTGKGNLKAFPKGVGATTGLSVNYNTIDTNLANAGTVMTTAGAGTDITVASNFSSAHVTLQVLGYYYPAPTGNLSYIPVTPCKIIDTRKTSAGMIDAGTQRNFYVFGGAGTIAGQGGDTACPQPPGAPPGGPLAAHINMVAVNPAGKGNLKAFPMGVGATTGLSVNYNTIDTNLANAGTIKTTAGTGKDFTVASNYSSAHVTAQVLGYYYPAGDLLYTPVKPCKIVDTRKTSAGIIGGSTERDFHVFGNGATISAQGGTSAGCPSPLGDPLAAHINMVAVNPAGKGNLKAFPMGVGATTGLSVNYNTIDTNLANAGTVKTTAGTGTDITVASNFSSAHVTIQVLGYYYPEP